jgi:succinate dehydrogenase hydrophobic anchor subunit
LWLYERSLATAFAVLFLLSFVLHAIGGVMQSNEERMTRGLPGQSLIDFVSSSQFWFESFQNWQSEFLAVFSIVVLTIFLRHRGSPQSKSVAVPHSKTEG